VDDDSNILRLFATILSEDGYDVSTLQSSTAVFETLDRSGPFDLVILDLCMPKPDGFEILPQMRSRYPGLKVLVTSGLMGETLLHASEFLGATATLTKTEAPERLLSRVSGLLRG
jgi:DNA-binding NtrC family response regulator